jgi:hypothetical protein
MSSAMSQQVGHLQAHQLHGLLELPCVAENAQSASCFFHYLLLQPLGGQLIERFLQINDRLRQSHFPSHEKCGCCAGYDLKTSAVAVCKGLPRCSTAVDNYSGLLCAGQWQHGLKCSSYGLEVAIVLGERHLRSYRLGSPPKPHQTGTAL